MNKFFQIIFVILIALLQITIMPFLSFYGVWPNLILILVVMLILNGFNEEGFIAAGVGGLVMEFASIYFFGFYSLVFVAVAVILYFLNSRFLNEPNFYLSLAILAIFVFVYDGIFLLLTPNMSWSTIIFNIAYSLLIAWPTYHLLSYYHKRINETELTI